MAWALIVESARANPSARRIAACRAPSASRIAACFAPSATRIADAFLPAASVTEARRVGSAFSCGLREPLARGRQPENDAWAGGLFEPPQPEDVQALVLRDDVDDRAEREDQNDDEDPDRDEGHIH